MNAKKKHMIGLLAGIAADVIFGFSFMASKVALQYVQPTVLLAFRFTIATVTMALCWLLSAGINRRGGHVPLQCHFRRKPVWRLVVLGLVHPAAYCLLENYGILYTSSAVAGTILAVVPVCCIFVDVVLLHRSVTPRQVVCAIGAVGGVALVSVGGEVKLSVLGLLFLLLTMATDTAYYVMSHQAATYFSAFEVTFMMFAVSAAVMVPLVSIQYAGRYAELLPALQAVPFWLSTCYLALISSLLGYGLLNYAGGKLTVPETSLLSNIITVVSILAGVLLLREPFTLWQLGGVVVILGCVTVANLGVKE